MSGIIGVINTTKAKYACNMAEKALSKLNNAKDYIQSQGEIELPANLKAVEDDIKKCKSLLESCPNTLKGWITTVNGSIYRWNKVETKNYNTVKLKKIETSLSLFKLKYKGMELFYDSLNKINKKNGKANPLEQIWKDGRRSKMEPNESMLETLFKGTRHKASDTSVDEFIVQAFYVMAFARASLNTDTKTIYGNSHTQIPGDFEEYSSPAQLEENVKYLERHNVNLHDTVRYLSCDRLIARTLYYLGYRDQPKGGITCGPVAQEWLTKHGFEVSNNVDDIKYGSIIMVKHPGSDKFGHMFINVSFDKDTWESARFDSGSNLRISTEQPISVKEWAYRKDDFMVFNIPEKDEVTLDKHITTLNDLKKDKTATAIKNGNVITTPIKKNKKKSYDND